MGEHKSKDSKRKSKKEGKEHREHRKHKKSSSKKHHSESETEIDYNDPSLWVETGESEAPEWKAVNAPTELAVAADEITVDQPKREAARHDWMLNETFDFSSLGETRIKKEDKPKPNPDEPVIHERELNVHLKSGLHVDQYPVQEKAAIKFGDAGSNWRMKKLQRIMEQAEDEGRNVKDVALERYGSREKAQEAFDEREFLDNRKRRGRRDDNTRSRDGRSDGRDDTRRYMFTSSDTKSNQSFYRPSDRRRSVDEPQTKLDEFGRERKRRRQSRSRSRSPTKEEKQKQIEESAKRRLLEATHSSRPHTPVIITQHEMPNAFSSEPVLSRDELNKMNAKVVKAKLMGSADAEKLEKEYNIQSERTAAMQAATNGLQNVNGTTVAVLPTVDSDGRIYDFALSASTHENSQPKKKKEKFAGTHDPITGERIKYSASDDSMSLMEMVRQEKAGSKMTNDMDLEFANRIVSDVTFENNLDYMDEKSDVMAAKKGMSEEQKMRYAVNDFKRTQKVLEKCRFCYHDENPPQCTMISLATQTYLALPNVQELVPGHCMIVPLQHITSTLECDDTTWNEIRNFQKCLLQMFHVQNKGVIFMETVTNIRGHRHTVIEAIPVPYGVYEDMPAYFKEAIMAVDEEWSQHKKLIDTTERGFRNSMVKNLPYFHVWCGLGKSYGHVIENEKEFPHWFGKEIIAGPLDIGPELWRRPKYHHYSESQTRQKEFLKSWEKWDWTASLD
ncbi:CwfJ C-terminus 1-domain-containing protein-like protein [Phycomyces blakesleeanus]